MRRYVIGTMGVVVAGLGGSAVAQDTRPAARIGAIQAVAGAEPAGVVYRGQSPAPSAGQPPAFSTPLPIPNAGPATPTTGTPPPGSFVDGPGLNCGPYGTTAPGGTYAGPLPGNYRTPPIITGGPTVVPPGFAGAVDPIVNGPWWWVTGEGLVWWTKGADLPPLLTTSSAAFSGIPGSGDTQLVYGGQQSNGFQPGFRLNLGRWLGACHLWAVDASFFYLPKQTDTLAANSNQYPVLARPFFNLNQNIPFVQLIASPGLSTGTFQAVTESTLWGGDINVRRYVSGNACRRLDLLGGFRYLSLDERLDITETFARTPNSNTGIGTPDAVSGIVMDSFHTQNRFYGAQFGFDWECRWGRWFTDLTGKVAIGAMNSTVNVDGGQQINLAGGGTQTAVGGLLALPGNIGTYSETKFAAVSDLGLSLGYHITPRLRATVGYNLLYVSHVLRPGDQIDLGLDVTRIPNFPVPGATPLAEVRPAPTFKGSDYWAQGVTLGLQFTW